MSELKKQNAESKDYKERFEFVLTTGSNIICQRYFKINNFNPVSLRSYELTEAIRCCVGSIKKDLKDKTNAYLSIFSPVYFNSVDEMKEYVEKHKEDFTYGQGFVVRGNETTDYALKMNENGHLGAYEIGYKFDDGELCNYSEENKTTYKFAFKVDGREVCAVTWDGYYPKFVRDKIDLSNKKGKYNESEVSSLSFEQSLLYNIVKDKNDLIYGIIKSICLACSQETSSYTTSEEDIISRLSENSARLFWDLI